MDPPRFTPAEKHFMPEKDSLMPTPRHRATQNHPKLIKVKLNRKDELPRVPNLLTTINGTHGSSSFRMPEIAASRKGGGVKITPESGALAVATEGNIT